jgi:transposase
MGEQLGLAVWTTDQAGPFQTVAYPGHSWERQGHPQREPHEYMRNGTAKLLTLFHPADGELRTKGVTSCTNVVLHGWLKQELSAILATLPEPATKPPPAAGKEIWATWTAGLTGYPSIPAELAEPRMLLVLDNLAGHLTPAFVIWLFDHGIIPLYTPLGGSWLNMAESIQRIIERRAVEGQHPQSPAEIIAWLEAATQGWNRQPTPFVWGGKRAARRFRSRQRHYALGGSGAYTYRPIRRRKTVLDKWLQASQVTH